MTISTWNSPSPRLTWSITKSVVLQSITVQKLGRIQNYTGPDRYNSCAGNSPWTCSPCYDSCTPCVPPRRRTGTCRANTTGPPSQSMCLIRCETSEIALSNSVHRQHTWLFLPFDWSGDQDDSRVGYISSILDSAQHGNLVQRLLMSTESTQFQPWMWDFPLPNSACCSQPV